MFQHNFRTWHTLRGTISKCFAFKARKECAPRLCCATRFANVLLLRLAKNARRGFALKASKCALICFVDSYIQMLQHNFRPWQTLRDAISKYFVFKVRKECASRLCCVARFTHVLLLRFAKYARRRLCFESIRMSFEVLR